MTRGNVRELAIHLIYAREFTGEEPAQLVADRLNKEYYAQLAGENTIFVAVKNKEMVPTVMSRFRSMMK